MVLTYLLLLLLHPFNRFYRSKADTRFSDPEVQPRVELRPYRFLHCDWLQPRATSQKNKHVYFWLQSHRSCITVAVTIVNKRSHGVGWRRMHGCRSRITVTIVNTA